MLELYVVRGRSHITQREIAAIKDMLLIFLHNRDYLRLLNRRRQFNRNDIVRLLTKLEEEYKDAGTPNKPQEIRISNVL